MYFQPFEALRFLQELACLRNFVPGANCEECVLKAVKRDSCVNLALVYGSQQDSESVVDRAI